MFLSGTSVVGSAVMSVSGLGGMEPVGLSRGGSKVIVPELERVSRIDIMCFNDPFAF